MLSCMFFAIRYPLFSPSVLLGSPRAMLPASLVPQLEPQDLRGLGEARAEVSRQLASVAQLHDRLHDVRVW